MKVFVLFTILLVVAHADASASEPPKFTNCDAAFVEEMTRQLALEMADGPDRVEVDCEGETTQVLVKSRGQLALRKLKPPSADGVVQARFVALAVNEMVRAIAEPPRKDEAAAQGAVAPASAVRPRERSIWHVDFQARVLSFPRYSARIAALGGASLRIGQFLPRHLAWSGEVDVYHASAQTRFGSVSLTPFGGALALYFQQRWERAGFLVGGGFRFGSIRMSSSPSDPIAVGTTTLDTWFAVNWRVLGLVRLYRGLHLVADVELGYVALGSEGTIGGQTEIGAAGLMVSSGLGLMFAFGEPKR